MIFLPTVVPAIFEPFYGKANSKIPLLLLTKILGWLADRFGVRIVSFLGFLLLLPSLTCLRFVTFNTLEQKVLLCALLAFVGGFVDLGTPALMLEMQDVLRAVEGEKPGIFGSKGAIAQSFGLYSMAYALGLLLGPLWAGPVLEKAGWGTMGWTLGLLAGVTAMPVIALGEGWFRAAKVSDTGTVAEIWLHSMVAVR